ncbi:sulfur carrier protein ThiS [Brachybacterium hainanense]|uniref:Sulfur carrier protein ThiS n=1 Tax=Brachybacterium hainanense TaxID=1541174 RepID=A0ABV6R6U8_9MICO
MSIPLTVNGEAAEVPPGSTVRDLVAARLGHPVGEDGRSLDGRSLGVAVALDDAVIPRSLWSTTPLAADARCEFVTAVQGG